MGYPSRYSEVKKSPFSSDEKGLSGFLIPFQAPFSSVPYGRI
jgi:hypothetical protein